MEVIPENISQKLKIEKINDHLRLFLFESVDFFSDTFEKKKLGVKVVPVSKLLSFLTVASDFL